MVTHLHTVTNPQKVKLLSLLEREKLNPKEAKTFAGLRAKKVLETVLWFLGLPF